MVWDLRGKPKAEPWFLTIYIYKIKKKCTSNSRRCAIERRFKNYTLTFHSDMVSYWLPLFNAIVFSSTLSLFLVSSFLLLPNPCVSPFTSISLPWWATSCQHSCNVEGFLLIWLHFHLHLSSSPLTSFHRSRPLRLGSPGSR